MMYNNVTRNSSLLCIALWAGLANADAIISGNYETPPLPYVTISIDQKSAVGSTWNQIGPGDCYISAFVYGAPGAMRPGYEYYLEPREQFGSDVYCMGVQTAGRGTVLGRGTAQMILDRMKQVALPWKRVIPNAGNLFPEHMSFCWWTVYIRVGNMMYRNHGMTNEGLCHLNSAPKPVSCSILDGIDVVHPRTSTGGVYSRKKVQLNVLCDGDASVTIDAPRNAAVLRSGNNRLDSGLYLNKEGSHTATINATPHGSVDVISVVDTDIKFAGAYNGSVVLTATWD